jgi:DNA-directed RNA polymerase specialized sigma24 family protein
MTQVEGKDTPITGAAGSVTLWLGDLKRGGDAAAQHLWERYFLRLVGLAREHLRGTPRGMADEEDAASKAIKSFFSGVARGRFPQLNDRNDLWRILVVLTVRKALEQRRDLTRQKRGGKAPAGTRRGLVPGVELDQLADSEPDPAVAAMLADECRWRLEGLGDETLRRVAELRMAGYTNIEIAKLVGVTKATVDRKLAVIRRKWTADQPS